MPLRRYFGSGAVPVTVKPASAFASVSSGCAPPSVSVYLPAKNRPVALIVHA